MNRCIIADINAFESRVALLEDNHLVEIQLNEKAENALSATSIKDGWRISCPACRPLLST